MSLCVVAGACRGLLDIEEPVRRDEGAGGVTGASGDGNTAAEAGASASSMGGGGAESTAGKPGDSGSLGGEGGAAAGSGAGPGAGGNGGPGGQVSDAGQAGLSSGAGAGGESATSCDGDPRELLLWTLFLGQQDYVALKNPTRCPIELGGLQIHFDDREDAFPLDAGFEELDCTLQLPSFTLAPGASIRVHEYARPGDIAALDNKLTACPADLSFNPERGGLTYLCLGPCAPGALIDMVAHAGYSPTFRDPPAVAFGASLDVPLSGVGSDSQDGARYQRVAAEGGGGNFLRSDWKLQRRLFAADFEDGLDQGLNAEIRGALVPWQILPGQPAEFEATAASSAVGNVSLLISHVGSDGVSSALIQDLTDVSKPAEVSYFARTESSGGTGYFDLMAQTFSVIQVSFESTGLGVELENGQRAEIEFVPETWYQIEMRDIDYQAKRFDLYIDRALVFGQLPFWSNQLSLDQLHLYGVSAGSAAYFDGIELWE